MALSASRAEQLIEPERGEPLSTCLVRRSLNVIAAPGQTDVRRRLVRSEMDLGKQPYLIPILFVGLWLFLSAIFAFTSGWCSLAQYFRASERPVGEKILGQVKQIGFVPENHVTHIIVSSAGLYLYASVLFRFLHPALLIPWSEVHHTRTIKILWWRTYQFDLASITSIRVTQTAYDLMLKYAT